jgi:hypothetical protein
VLSILLENIGNHQFYHKKSFVSREEGRRRRRGPRREKGGEKRGG